MYRVCSKCCNVYTDNPYQDKPIVELMRNCPIEHCDGQVYAVDDLLIYPYITYFKNKYRPSICCSGHVRFNYLSDRINPYFTFRYPLALNETKIKKYTEYFNIGMSIENERLFSIFYDNILLFSESEKDREVKGVRYCIEVNPVIWEHMAPIENRYRCISEFSISLLNILAYVNARTF